MKLIRVSENAKIKMDRISTIANHLRSQNLTFIHQVKVNNEDSIQVSSSEVGVTITLTRPKALNALTIGIIAKLFRRSSILISK